MNKRYVLWGGLVGVMLVVALVMVRLADQETENAVTAGNATSEHADLLEPREDDWIKGNPDADVVVVKYSDFQCPACRFYASMDDRLSRDLEEDVLFVYRHFPLQNFRYSMLASRFAEAAGKQGEFWRMHDLIYINQQRWARSDDGADMFMQFAESLELDMDQFRDDLDDPEIRERIEAQYESGQRLGVRSVPSLFINGEPIENPRSMEDYRSLIESYL
ncbi:thioredoxin domain-containing protein [Balneolales bacterium ANBcel1]|nr:thioredoxin domain-containing protein [Balneolales bacterium ANBcel1]